MAVIELSAGRSAARLGMGLAAGSFLLLAACTGAPGPSPYPGTFSPEMTPPTAPPAVGSSAPRESAAIAPPPTSPPQDVQRLIGLKGDLLRQWMGETVFVRHDGIAEIWRFASDTCFLDVFLYRESDGLRVAHLDARARNGNQRFVIQSCYGAILAGRKKASS